MGVITFVYAIKFRVIRRLKINFLMSMLVTATLLGVYSRIYSWLKLTKSMIVPSGKEADMQKHSSSLVTLAENIR